MRTSKQWYWEEKEKERGRQGEGKDYTLIFKKQPNSPLNNLFLKLVIKTKL